MNLTVVMLVCVGGLIACAALVFVVETTVAFLLHEAEPRLNRPGVVTMALPVAEDDFEVRRAA